MEYQKIDPVRPPPMEPLPENDTLYRFDNGIIIRLRVTAKNGAGEIASSSQGPADNETINLKFRCSFCKDESGDVRKDDTGAHLLWRGETHSITLEDLVDRKVSFEAWLIDHVDKMLVIAWRKATARDQIMSRFRFTPEPTSDQSQPG